MRDAGSHFFSPHLSVPRVPQQHAGCSRHPHPYQALPGHSAGPGRACLRPHSRRPAAPAAGQREGKRVAAAARVQESDRGAMAMAGPGGAWRGSSCHQLASHLSTHAQCMGVAWAGNERVAGYEADRRGGGRGATMGLDPLACDRRRRPGQSLSLKICQPSLSQNTGYLAPARHRRLCGRPADPDGRARAGAPSGK
jgi:hypothetical protein